MLEEIKEHQNENYIHFSESNREENNNFLHFPTSNEPDPFLKYRNGLNYNSNRKKRKADSQSNFLKRNYTIKKEEKNKMMTEKDLNSLYYKLKIYYNDILSQNKKEERNINDIKIKNKKVENKIIDFERAKEVESGIEKISGLDVAKNIDAEINKINDLKQRNEDAKFGVTNETEYASTLKYLMEDSHSQLIKIREDSLIIEQKLKDIKQARKVLKENINNRNYNKRQTQKINNFLENQIEKINEMLYEQEYKKMSIEKENKEKEEKLQNLKERYNKDKKINKYKLAQYKEETLERISAYYYQKENKENNEKKIINFIVGFYFFQKYFINKNRENKGKNDLEDSIDISECKKDIEFNHFMKGEQYELNNSEEEDNDNPEKINDKNPETSKSNYLENKNLKSQRKKKKVQKITFEEIKNRFDELDLQYDEFYDYYTKIISRANFSRKKMTSLNDELINLESLKNKYRDKVDDIILKDYKNLTDLIEKIKEFDEMKRESIIRFAKFIEKNKYTLKNAEKIRNLNAIKRISDLHQEEIVNPDTTLIKKRNIFIDKCTDASYKIKFYFESIIIGMRHLNNFREYDNVNKTETKISKEIIKLTSNFVNKCKETNIEKYVEDLLNFATEKNIDYSQQIYKTLFKEKRKKENMIEFLKDKLTDDNFMFYFFRTYNDRNKLNMLLNQVIDFYSGKNIRNSYNSSKYSISDKILDANSSKFNKQGSIKSSVVDYSSSKTKDFKKSKTNLILFMKPNEEKEEVEKKKTLEDEINGEYNYEKTVDDSEDINYHKIIRPKTTKIPTSKRIVQQLYEPSLEKSQYLRNLNNDLNNIKSETSKKKKGNSKYFKKTWGEIDNLENQFFVYNNPSKNIFLFF